MKLLILVILLSFCQQAHSQDLFGRQNSNRMQLIYIGKVETPNGTLSVDSSFIYTGLQGGTVVYNPYEILGARILTNAVPGSLRVEFAGGVDGKQEGWLPFFVKSAGGLVTMVQSNSPDCDCNAESEKIGTQIDVQTYTMKPPLGPFNGNINETFGCVFTIYIYWISEL